MNTHTIITKTYAAHGIALEAVASAEGPQVVRHLFDIAPGTKISKVVGLTEELQMALGIEGVAVSRQGRHIAVDVPREIRQFVEWTPLGSRGLEFFAGLDLSGKIRRVDLAKAPHLLIAGSTGSGKSVAINAILTDWLTRLGPDELRLHIVDPKRVELGRYSRLPQVEQFASGAGWEVEHLMNILTTIMDQRFERFEDEGVRDIDEYRAKHPDQPMPYQVLVVDEFADLMLDKSHGKDIERSVIRIAQLGRAAGVHMLLATQRPSMQVFTGLIKANVPGRWIFRVNSGVDSRIALDQMGAEDLLGAGDSLLLLPGSPADRIQCAAPSAEDFDCVAEYGKALWPDPDFGPQSSLAPAQPLPSVPVAREDPEATTEPQEAAEPFDEEQWLKDFIEAEERRRAEIVL